MTTDYIAGCEVCEANAQTYGVITAEAKVEDLEKEVSALKVRIAELELATQWRSMDTYPNGEWVLILVPYGFFPPGTIMEFKFRVVDGTDGTWQRRDGALLRGGIGDNFIAWLPILKIPEGIV